MFGPCSVLDRDVDLELASEWDGDMRPKIRMEDWDYPTVVGYVVKGRIVESSHLRSE